MVKKKEAVISCKLTMKNRIYLEILGYIDGRTGRATKEGPKISTLINRLMTDMLEKGKGYEKEVATPNTLKVAYLNFNLRLKEKERDKLADELYSIAKQIKEAKQ